MAEILICTAKVRIDGSLESCRNPRADQDPEATNRHCQPCRTAAQRRYMADKNEQQKGKGYADGIEAMRQLLAREFAAFGEGGNFSGKDVAELITRAPGPLRASEATTS